MSQKKRKGIERPAVPGRGRPVVADVDSEGLTFRRSLVQFFMIAGALMIFWFVLSGKADVVHLGEGLFCSLGIAALTYRLVQSPGVGGALTRPGILIPWHRFLVYIPWLIKEVVLANFQVARTVLHPGLPIDPQIVKFRMPLPHTMAQLTLTNSITLTPGTVTLDVRGDEFTVHALTQEAADSLLPEDMSQSMQARVANLFRDDSGSLIRDEERGA